MLGLEQVNALERTAFVAAFGGVYEHSPWVAERAWEQRPFRSMAALQAAMRDVVDAAGTAAQLALLRAHPRLGLRAGLTASSQAEQDGAGLHVAAAEAQRHLAELNRAYEARFDFPFIIAVRGLDTAAIIAAATQRLARARAVEFDEALRQVHRIAALRLADLCAGAGHLQP